MFGTFGTILLIVSIIFGGSGVTVAAAQSSMPDQPLYPVKTWSENLRTQMTTGEMNQLHLALEMAERRAEEMQMMFRAGQTPPQAVQNRWEGQLDEALRLAAGLTHDPQFQAHLEQIRTMAQVQQQSFEQVGLQKDPAGEALLTRTRAKLGEVLMLCQQGQQDPNAFQQMVQEMEKKQLKDGEQAGDPAQEQEQNQEQNGDPDGDQYKEQNQEKNQEQNGEPAVDPNQEQNREQYQYQECDPEDGCDGDGPYGPGAGSGPGPGDGAGGASQEGSGGSGSDDPGSDNTGETNAGSDATGSDNTGGDASGSESNGSGDTGGESGGTGGGDNGGSGGGGGGGK